MRYRPESLILILLLVSVGLNFKTASAGDQKMAGDLIELVKKGDAEQVLIWLKKGADVHVRNQDGETALMWAAGGGYVKVAEALIQAGANINSQDSHEKTPLIWAAEKGQIDALRL